MDAKGESGKPPKGVNTKEGAYAQSARRVGPAKTENIQGFSGGRMNNERGGNIKTGGGGNEGGGGDY